jgi:hypothetical protein
MPATVINPNQSSAQKDTHYAANVKRTACVLKHFKLFLSRDIAHFVSSTNLYPKCPARTYGKFTCRKTRAQGYFTDFIYIMISHVAYPQFSALLLLPVTSNLTLSRDLVCHLFRVSSFAFCAGHVFVLCWCPVPAVRGVRKCLNSVVGPRQVRDYGLRFRIQSMSGRTLFSDPQACFCLRYEVIVAVAVDPAELVPFKVVNEEDRLS